MRILKLTPGGRIPAEVTNYLLPHEHTVISVHRHPAILIVPISVFAATCISAVIFTVFVVSDSAVGLAIVWGACLVVLLYLLVQVIAWQRSYFVVTRARILFIGGLATRTVTTLPTAKMTDLSLVRSTRARLLGYGKIIARVEDAPAMPINYVPYPEQVYEEVREIVLQLGDYADDEREPERDETL